MPARRRRAPPARVLTEFLQSCLCTRGPGEGQICPSCGNHEEVDQHNSVCTLDDCDGDGELLGCTGCNMAYHLKCMGTIKWGLDAARNEAPWCEDCFDEWHGVEDARRGTPARGDTTIDYTTPTRADGPDLGADPLLSPTPGRRQQRLTRSGPQVNSNVPFRGCRRQQCKLECRRPTDQDRQKLRDEFDRLRRDLKTGARHRAMEFANSFLKNIFYYTLDGPKT